MVRHELRVPTDVRNPHLRPHSLLASYCVIQFRDRRALSRDWHTTLVVTSKLWTAHGIWLFSCCCWLIHLLGFGSRGFSFFVVYCRLWHVWNPSKSPAPHAYHNFVREALFVDQANCCVLGSSRTDFPCCVVEAVFDLDSRDTPSCG